MKRFLLIFGLLGCAWAQTTTTITGTIKDLTGALVTSGKVVFTLTPNRDTTISGVARFTPTSVVCLINGSGLIKAQDGVSVCTLTMNTALQPTGTYYTVAVWPNNVKTSQFTFYAVNSSYDWSTVVPTPTTSPAQNYVDVFSNQTIGGNKVWSGTQTFNGIVSTPSGLITESLNGTLYADQFAGSDGGAQINAAIAACGTGCTTVDARAIANLNAAATINISKGITLKMPEGSISLSGNPGILLSGSNAALECGGPNQTALITSSGTADIVQVTGSFGSVKDCGFRSSVVRTAGAGLELRAGNGNFEHLRFDKTYFGILANTNAVTGAEFHDIQMGAGLSGSGSWNCGVFIGGVASGTVTSISFHNLFISEDAPFSDAAICIYDGADTIYFYGTNIGQGGAVAHPIHIGRLVSGALPQWIKFIGGNFEADSTSNNTVIDYARDVEFIGATIQNGVRGIWTTTLCVACEFIGGNISQFQQEAVKMSSPLKIVGAHIGDAGQQTDNTFDTIHIDANVSDFQISDVVFEDVTGLAPANTARYNINIDAGTSDRYTITGNDFGQAHSTFLSAGSGTNVFIANPASNIYLGGNIAEYNGRVTAGQGVPPITAITSQKAETAADTNVLTFTPPAAAGSYRACFTLSLSAANAATLGWTATWKDSNGNAQSPTNLSLFQSGAAAPALTFVTSAPGNYSACQNIDIDNSATNVVIKLTFTGTSFAGKASAWLERYI